MLRYILKRVAVSVVVLFGIAALTFLIVHLIPGDPARIQLGANATPQSVADLRATLGLDRPLGEQFVSYLGNAATGQFGDSIVYRSSVGK